MPISKEDALKLIKQLRDKINTEADTTATAKGWENAVVEALDKAGDLIEFPKQ